MATDEAVSARTDSICQHEGWCYNSVAKTTSFARLQSASVTGKRFMDFLLCGGRPPAKLRARAVPRPTRIVDPLLVTTLEKLMSSEQF